MSAIPLADSEASRIRAAESRIPVATAQDDELRKVAELVAKVKELTEKNAGLESKVAALQGENRILTREKEMEEERAGFWKEANSRGRDVSVSCDAAVAGYKGQLERADNQIEAQQAEIERLRNPGFLSSLFKPDTVVKVGGGMALGRATCPK